MLIWFLLAIALVVIFIVSVAGRRRYGSTAAARPAKSHPKSHRGADARRHRGRGRH